MLQCIEYAVQNEEGLNRGSYTRVIIKDLQLNKIYGTIDDNNKVVILGVLRSNAQCGYANGIFVHPTHRCIFVNPVNGGTVKIIKKWDDYLVEMDD